MNGWNIVEYDVSASETPPVDSKTAGIKLWNMKSNTAGELVPDNSEPAFNPVITEPVLSGAET